MDSNKEIFMPKEFGHWLQSLQVAKGEKREVNTSSPDLMRSVAELEEDLDERKRNLYPSDPTIPRGRWPEEVHRILCTKTLPAEYVDVPVWQHAHQLYWQIEALKGKSDALPWHPV